MNRAQGGWSGILEPGERIIWQGQPESAPDFSRLSLRRLVTGGVVTLFALFWVWQAALATQDVGFPGILMPIFGLLFVGLGLWRMGGSIVWDSFRRRHIWYSLSNRRAFIATDLFGRKDLAAYPLGPMTVLDHDGRDPGNIWFATDYVKTRRGDRRKKVGFENLPSAFDVYRKMVDIQQNQGEPSRR